MVLAVPVDARVILYDFLLHNQESEARWVYLVDLLPALDASGEVSLSLVLEPKNPADFTTSGVFLPDLLVLDGGVLPTATPGSQSPTLP